MSQTIYPQYQIPFIHFIFESLAVLTFTVALLPGAYLRVFYITIPLLISTLILAYMQDSDLKRYSIINLFVSILLLYLSYNSRVISDSQPIFIALGILLALVGILLSTTSIVSIASDVFKHYKANKKFNKPHDKSQAADIKPNFRTRKPKTVKAKK